MSTPISNLIKHPNAHRMEWVHNLKWQIVDGKMQATCSWAEFLLLVSQKSDALEICEVFNAVVPINDSTEAHLRAVRWHGEDEVTLTAELSRDIDF